MNIVGLTIIVTIYCALTTYIARIEGKLNRLMLQNLGLLDGMHEGIIVLSGDDKSLEFANQPAIELINQGYRGANSILEEIELIAKPIFKPTTLSLV